MSLQPLADTCLKLAGELRSPTAPLTRGRVAEVLEAAGKALSAIGIRHHDQSTSEKGATSVSFRAGSQCYRMLQQYAQAGDSGLTDLEAARMAELSDPGTAYWMRASDLRRSLMIEPTGEERSSSLTDEKLQVCRITRTGLEYLRRVR